MNRLKKQGNGFVERGPASRSEQNTRMEQNSPATGANALPLGNRPQPQTSRCFFCLKNGHIRPNCEKFRKLVDAKEIHVNDERRLA
jgi:hypothetical protein